MEIIHNSTGGRVPKFWRPPFGDSDNRVRAIASEVFGLTTLMWNQEYVSSFFFRHVFSYSLQYGRLESYHRWYDTPNCQRVHDPVDYR